MQAFRHGEARAVFLIALLSSACSSREPVQSVSSPLPAVPVRVAAQNELYTQPLSCGAVPGTVISLGGTPFLQQGTVTPEYPDGLTFEGFLQQTKADVMCKLGQFLTNHPEIESNARPDWCGGQCPSNCRVSRQEMTVVIDVEKPSLADLQDFGSEWSSPERTAVVNAFRRRSAAAHAVFPYAKLGFYGTLVPDGQGRANNASYLANKEALTMAARYQGLLDKIDYLVPVLYARFGCDDESATSCPVCDPHWDTLEAMTRLGIDGSRSIDFYRPLLPILGFGVNNGKSCFHHKLFLDFGIDDAFGATMGKQIAILREKAGGGEFGGPIDSMVLWAGQNSNVLPDDPNGPWVNPNGRTVTDYTDQLCSNP